MRKRGFRIDKFFMQEMKLGAMKRLRFGHSLRVCSFLCGTAINGCLNHLFVLGELSSQLLFLYKRSFISWM